MINRRQAEGLNCPAAFYCAEGVYIYAKCLNETYCPESTPSPIACPSGTFGSGNPNNVNQASGCLTCDPGTYSVTTNPGVCLPCPAGYVCTGGTTSATPQTEAADGGYPCPKGHYCVEGSREAVACPVGTYNNLLSGTSDAACISCPVGEFNNKEG